ncbi:MAG: uracil-DNA glycosylase [Gammaproteobacteria bacterium]
MIDSRQHVYLERMGIAVWVRRTGQLSESDNSVVSLAINIRGTDAANMDWQTLEQHVSTCTDCALHANRKQAVFGTGNQSAEWMIIGEAPGAEEDKLGLPFVGRAGKLLDAMLKAAGYERDDVFIANILKCRPPRNRDPKPNEAAACSQYLHRQIALVRPKIILAVGRIAAQNLLATDAPLGRMRGKIHRHEPSGTPVIVTYHPAYLLRSPLEKRKAWEDLCFARRVCREVEP